MCPICLAALSVVTVDADNLKTKSTNESSSYRKSTDVNAENLKTKSLTVDTENFKTKSTNESSSDRKKSTVVDAENVNNIPSSYAKSTDVSYALQCANCHWDSVLVGVGFERPTGLCGTSLLIKLNI